MNLNSFKGTLYDLLGYFAPGLVSIICSVSIMLKINDISALYGIFKEIGKNITALEVFTLIIIAYMLGHAIASLSSWLIEKNLIEKVSRLNKLLDSKSILGDEHYEALCTKYKMVFNTQYNDKSIRRIICHVQAKQNFVYETALIFLSFYGMARNFSFIFGACFCVEVWYCVFKGGKFHALILFALLCVVFLYEYIRFRKYFLDTILSGFLIPEKENFKEKN